jgi:hypothetical protein
VRSKEGLVLSSRDPVDSSSSLSLQRSSLVIEIASNRYPLSTQHPLTRSPTFVRSLLPAQRVHRLRFPFFIKCFSLSHTLSPLRASAACAAPMRGENSAHAAEVSCLLVQSLLLGPSTAQNWWRACLQGKGPDSRMVFVPVSVSCQTTWLLPTLDQGTRTCIYSFHSPLLELQSSPLFPINSFAGRILCSEKATSATPRAARYRQQPLSAPAGDFVLPQVSSSLRSPRLIALV